MFKKILSMFLAAVIVTLASGSHVFAQKTNAFTDNQPVVKAENNDSARDLKSKELKSLIAAQSTSDPLHLSDKSTLAEYERAKRQGKGFSTTTKVLIGVGIAAVVIGIVVFAASRDKVRTF